MTPMEYRKQKEALREEHAKSRRQKLLKEEENRRLLESLLGE